MAGELMPVAMKPDFSIDARAPGTWTRRMTLRHLAATSLLALALTTGCSPMPHGDPNNPQKNPHPVQRYQVIATADAPGSWDSVKGRVFFDVTNENCTPEDKFLGVHEFPRDVTLHVDMTRIDQKTWKGYFYRDYMQDENYYELGPCHWDATGVAVDYVAGGVTFTSSLALGSFPPEGAQATYFRKIDVKKSEEGNPDLVRYGPAQLSSSDPEVIRQPDAHFPITVTIKEVTP